MVRARLWVVIGLVAVGCGGESESGSSDAAAKAQACNDADTLRSQILDEAAKQGVSGPCEQPDGSAAQQYFAAACAKYEQKHAACCAESPAFC